MSLNPSIIIQKITLDLQVPGSCLAFCFLSLLFLFSFNHTLVDSTRIRVNKNKLHVESPRCVVNCTVPVRVDSTIMRVKLTCKVFFYFDTQWSTPTESTRKFTCFTKAHCKRNIGFSPKHDLRGLRCKVTLCVEKKGSAIFFTLLLKEYLVVFWLKNSSQLILRPATVGRYY
jgi:hypothetical protein